MTERLYLHVGAPKSGTTYLQSMLRANRARLADAGVLVVGERHAEVVYAGLIIRDDPRTRSLSPRDAASWQRLIAQITGWEGQSAILSYELFAGASADQARAVLAAFPGIEVHLVFSARDLGRALPSAWQERLKFGIGKPLETWVPRQEEDGPRAEWGWRTMDPAGVTARWAADLPPERVHIVTVPRAGVDRHELWHRFARACAIEVPGLDLGVTVANESLGPVQAELLRRVNLHLGTRGDRIGAVIAGNREHARWIRDTLAHQILVPLGDQPGPDGTREGLGMTDDQFAEAEARSTAAIEALRARGYDVQGDLEDIRATRSTGRTPGEVTDAELVETAAQAIAAMLVQLRAQTLAAEKAAEKPAEPTPAPVAGAAPLLRRGRSVAGRVVGGAGATYANRRMDKMAARIAELESEVQHARLMQRRVAELEDVVMELLVPTAAQDEELLANAIRAYRQGSL